jgi:hypothetical protein
MSFFVAGILRIIMLEASAALLVIARLVKADDRRGQRRLDVAFRALAVIALFSWTNYGTLRGGGNLVHRWEQYHFFFGSKFLPEVNYFDLYKATILADRELGGRITSGLRITRDLATFDDETVETALPVSERTRIRANFSDGRWHDFVADWDTLSRGNANWAQVLDDHGNSGSPAWALIAAPIARLVGIGPTGQTIMGLIDPLLMLALFIACFYTFGTRPTCTMLIIWSMVPFSFDYLAGSLLRWDWLFALGMCLVFWRRDKPLTAGAFLGYAVASKLFPLFFGVAFGFSAGWRMWRMRQLDRRVVRFVAGVVLAGVIAVAASSAMFGGLAVWKSYERRISTAQTEKFYNNQYSFRTLFLQVAHSTPRELAEGWMEPREIKQSRREVDIANHRGTFFFWQLVLTALVAVAVARGEELEALAAGPLLVYVWLVVNAYYWNMLALPALAWSLREFDGRRGRLAPLLFLHVLLIWFYVYQHLNHGFAEGYFVGVLMLALLLVYFVTSLRTRSTNVPA